MNNRKKQLTLMIIAIAIFLGIISFATYAFFAGTNTNVNVNANVITGGMYAFTATPDGEIDIEVKASDMMESGVNTTVPIKSDNANITVSLLSSSDTETTTCTYDIIWEYQNDAYTSADKTLTANEYEFSVKIDKDNEAVLAEKDLSKFEWSAVESKTRSVIYHGTTTSSSSINATTEKYTITANIYNININQEKLQNKNFLSKVILTNVSCSVAKGSTVAFNASTGGQILAVDNTNVSSELINGLYRYQGVGAQYCDYNNGEYYAIASSGSCPTIYKYLVPTSVDSRGYKYGTECSANFSDCTTPTGTIKNSSVNNYICFGTSSKSECVADKNIYFYRIIGIAEDGSVEVTKYKNIGSLVWDSTAEFNKWSQTTIYNYLNNDFYNSINQTWQNNIADASWNFITSSNLNSLSASELAALEQSSNDVTTAKVGLMHLSDLLYSSNVSNDQGSIQTFSWLSENKTSSGEWLMDNIGYNSSAGVWLAGSYSCLQGCCRAMGGPMMYSSTFASPVFYLKNQLTISGSGTSTDPFIIN